MPNVPLPFVITLLLAILFVRFARRGAADRWFLALIGLCTVQSVLVGLRWSYDLEAARFVMPVIAAAVAPLVFVSFVRLARSGAGPVASSMWLHAIPPALTAALVVFWRAPLDFVLVAIFLVYAVALLRMAGKGPDALGGATLESAVPAHRALLVAGLALLGSALVDVAVAMDFEWTSGRHAAAIVGLSNIVWLLALGAVAAVAGGSRPPAETADATISQAPIDTAADEDVISRIDTTMCDKELFRDADLNLNRLARRLGLPARRISGAVNRLRGQNVSQYINGYRIAEACRLLTETDQPVLPIMFEVGFETKSNFNREFRRITAMSPVEWRATQKRAD